MKLTPVGKLLLAIIGIALLVLSVKLFAPGVIERLVPSARPKPSVVPPKANLPPAATSSSGSSTPPSAAPASGAGASTTPGCPDAPEIRMYHWAWNAQAGLMLATGGKQSAPGSLMCANGVNLKLIREDMVDKMQEGLVTFATELKGGNPNPSKGCHFVAIMGDGAAIFLKGLNDTLSRLGPEYQAKVIGSCGYSRGEDKFMGPPEWKATPAASGGGLVAGVLRDGDWNIAQKWLGDNDLCNNPDETTWDAQCLNWVNASDYIDAAQKYVAGYCEDRPVVKAGRRTGETKNVCVQSVVTWTPGDVTVAREKGGLVSIVSTKEYSSQMPNVIIGIDKWMRSNRTQVEGFLSAITTAGDQIKADPANLRRAAEISAAVYNEAGADAAYWEKYFSVVTEKDKQGLNVQLGGSSVNNLRDNQLLFGLLPGSSNLFAATYTVFGDIVKAQYPELMPEYQPANAVLDASYVQSLAKRAPAQAQAPAAPPEFTAADRMKDVVSRKQWQINFDSGRATFTPAAEAQMEQLLRDLLVASSTVVEVHGHTDSAGTPESNMALSEARAFAVKQWLQARSPVNFPEGRVRVFSHGQLNPITPNTTPEGRAMNRRVEIVLGTT